MTREDRAVKLKPMDPAAVRAIVLARLEQGPATLTGLMSPIWKHCAETGELVPQGTTGLLATLRLMAGLGEIGCLAVGGRRDRGLVVWAKAADLEDARRRERARREALLRKKAPAQRGELVTLPLQAEAAKGGHSGDEAPGPMEVLARLAGCTTYTEPETIRGTRPGTTTDEIDFVLSAVADELARDMAFSMACHSTRRWAAVHRLGAPRMLATLQRWPSLAALVKDGKRMRVRILLHDVFHDLARHQRRPYRDAAKAAKMRERDYRNLYLTIEDELHGLAQQAARDAVDLLHGRVDDFEPFRIASASRPHQRV